MAAIEGRTVRLRPLTREDAGSVFPWYNDPEIVSPHDRFASETYDEFVRSLEAARQDPVSLAPRFGIERKEPRELIGVVGHYRPHPVLETVEVWYIIGRRDARGRGHGREAVELLVDHLFRSETIERVGATCDVANEPSVRLLERLGFRREGTLRSALFHHGTWHDIHVYGITRAESAARRVPPA